MREERHQIERYPSIEMSDKEYLEHMNRVTESSRMMNIRMRHNPQDEITGTLTVEPLEYNAVDPLTTKKVTVKLRKKDATSTSKTSLEKPKKNHSKANKPAMEKVQA